MEKILFHLHRELFWVILLTAPLQPCCKYQAIKIMLTGCWKYEVSNSGNCVGKVSNPLPEVPGDGTKRGQIKKIQSMNGERWRTIAEVVWVSFCLPGLLWGEKQLRGIWFFSFSFSKRFPYECNIRLLIYIYIIITLLNYICKSWHWRHLQGSKAPEWQLITFPSVPHCFTFLIPFSFYHCCSTLVLRKNHGNQWMQSVD